MEKKKGRNIVVIILVLVVLVIVGGLYLWDKDNTTKMENAMKEAALDYFDKYMSSNTGASAYKVTLEMLKKANEEGESYTLGVLDKCDDKTTRATVSIDYVNGEVTDTIVKLDCKKF